MFFRTAILAVPAVKLMDLNTYALEHVFWSETRAWMALVMGATMAVIMLVFMLGMYKKRMLNMAISADQSLSLHCRCGSSEAR
ncbi:MAG: hypothetical protein ACK4QP_02325 [Pseudorhizobium sp.]